jgi:hypothetical protein
LEPGSNVTAERESQSPKQSQLIFSTDAGMKTDGRAEQAKNALDFIDESLEPDSNVTLDKDTQRKKQCVQSFVIEEGMQMNGNDEQSRNADSSINES